MFEFIKKIFKKEEEMNYPNEFCIVTYNEMALRNGVEDFANKLIIRYRHNYRTGKIEVYRVYGYSESLLYNLRKKLKIPIYDKTEKEIKMPVYEEVNLDEVSYKKG